MNHSPTTGRATRKAQPIPKSLQPLAEAMRKHRSYQSLLPKVLRNSLIRDVWVFGSAVKGGHYNDVDVALFLNPQDPTFKTIAQIYIRRVGLIEYHVFPDNEEGREIFAAMLDMKTPHGRGYGIQLSSLAELYTAVMQI
jgi:predicted nucleotidyltransferase